MNFYCPRCRLPLHADVPRGRASVVTCPSCLELVTVHPPAPIPAIPISPAAQQGDRAIDYRAISGDVEAELQKDLRFAIWGIAVFGAMAVIGYALLKTRARLPGESIYWLGWIGGVTACIAIATFARHARRSAQVRRGMPVRTKTTGERVSRVIVLGIGGLLLVGLTIIAALVLLFAACLIAAGAGGFR
jgi:hypothetical protein